MKFLQFQRFTPPYNSGETAGFADDALAEKFLKRGDAFEVEDPAGSPAIVDDVPSPGLDLLGSSLLPAIVEIGGRQVQLGGLVVAAQRASGLDVEAWNALAEEEREHQLAATVERLNADPAAADAELAPTSVVDADTRPGKKTRPAA